MDFISKFNEYCGYDGWVPSFLWMDESVNTLNDLLSLYKRTTKENQFLIDKLLCYEIASEDKGEQILKKNLIKVIEELSNKKLLFSDTVKEIREVLISKIKSYQKQTISTHSKVAEEVYLLLQLFPTLSEIKSIFNENLTIDWYDWFFYFCIKSEDNRAFFNRILENYIKLFETAVVEDKYAYFFLWWEKYIDYIISDNETNNLFLNLLGNNPESLKKYFSWYYSDWKEAPFLNWSSTLTQKCIRTLIKEYYEKKDYNIERVLEQNLFQTIIKSQNKEIKFVSKLITYINEEKHQYFSASPIILKWLLTENTIDKIIGLKRWDRTILRLYYSIRREWDSNLVQKLYQIYQSIIDKNEEYIKDSNEKTEEENKNIKSEIEKIIDDLSGRKWKIIPSNILSLYKDHKDFFESYQIDFIKEQIDLYLTSDSTNPWNPKLWIEYSWENTFSWPWFIQDLELCIEIALSENIDLTKYRERIFYLIPYLFDSDYRKLVEGFDRNLNVTDNHLIDWILDVYSHKTNKGLWYFHAWRLALLFKDKILCIKDLNPEQYTRLREICKSMIQSSDTHVSIWDKKSYFDLLVENKPERIYTDWMCEYHEQLMEEHKWINYFDNYLRHNLPNINHFDLFIELNKALILLYKDKKAINWRVSQLLWINEDFEEVETTWVRWISNIERELVYWDYSDEFFYSVLEKVLKYPEYEDEMKAILNKAKKLWDKSEVKRYLRKFVAYYYKNIAEENKAKIYANIEDEDFVIYYLWIINWNDSQKIKYKIEKKNKNKNSFMKCLNYYHKNFIHRFKKHFIKRFNNLEKYNSWLVLEKNNLKDKVFIVTEWSTDRKILYGMAEYLKKIYPNKVDVYDFFVTCVRKYEDFDAWEGSVLKYIKGLAEMFPDKYIIWIFDADSKLKKDNNKDFKEILHCIYTLNSNDKCKYEYQNLRIIKLNEPRHYEECLEYYNEYWWCIELFFSKDVLRNYLIAPRDCCLERITDDSNIIWKCSYKGHILYIEKWKKENNDENNKISTIYERSSRFKINDDEGHVMRKNILTKSEFANLIFEWKLPMFISEEECKIFSKLFETIFDACQDIEKKINKI